MSGIARSVEGALAGGIVAIELYKWRHGISLRTGARFALPLAIGIAIGRLGCYFAGLDDFTYGTPTALPWGHDFGDGILRHPVQLYESVAMAALRSFYVVAVVRPQRLRHRQRLLSRARLLRRCSASSGNSSSPMAPLIGPLTLFHLLSLAILALCRRHAGDGAASRGDA